ncbi:hypothetical protein ACET3Z_002427 [Daucus carota]
MSTKHSKLLVLSNSDMGDKMVSNCKDIVLRNSDIDTLKGPCFLSDQIIAFYFTYLSCSFNTKTDMLLVPPSISLWIANCEDTTCVEDYVRSCEMSSKRLVLFVVNDNEDFGGGDGGNHWSILVYDRTKNLFLHFDSMMGVNTPYAVKLYDALKEFMGPGGESSIPHTSSSLTKQQRKKKKSGPSVQRGSKPTQPPVTRESEATVVSGLPMFAECETTPQQQNGYDCGLYVLAIARAIFRCWRSYARWLRIIERFIKIYGNHIIVGLDIGGQNTVVLFNGTCTFTPKDRKHKAPPVFTVFDHESPFLDNLSAVKDKKNMVFIVSARGRNTLGQWFSACENLGIGAEHGFFLRLNNNAEWETCAPVVDCSWKQIAEPVMKLYTGQLMDQQLKTRKLLQSGVMKMTILILVLFKQKNFLIILRVCKPMNQLQLRAGRILWRLNHSV